MNNLFHNYDLKISVKQHIRFIKKYMHSNVIRQVYEEKIRIIYDTPSVRNLNNLKNYAINSNVIEVKNAYLNAKNIPNE